MYRSSLTFLGSGTSQGVPLIGCRCPVCTSSDPKDKRLRTSALIQTPTHSILLDAGPDFRYQMLHFEVRRIDAILLTHSHRDHIAGLDEVRTYNYFQKGPIPLYGSKQTLDGVKRFIPYAFGHDRYPGAPEFDLHKVGTRAFHLFDLHIIPIKIQHYQVEVTGYRINDFTYITDAKSIEPSSVDKIRGTKTLVINALRKEPHPTHFSLSDALQLIEEIKPERAYLVHTGHGLGYAQTQAELPKGVQMAYDGLSIDIDI